MGNPAHRASPQEAPRPKVGWVSDGGRQALREFQSLGSIGGSKEDGTHRGAPFRGAPCSLVLGAPRGARHRAGVARGKLDVSSRDGPVEWADVRLPILAERDSGIIKMHSALETERMLVSSACLEPRNRRLSVTPFGGAQTLREARRAGALDAPPGVQRGTPAVGGRALSTTFVSRAPRCGRPSVTRSRRGSRFLVAVGARSAREGAWSSRERRRLRSPHCERPLRPPIPRWRGAPRVARECPSR